MTSGLFELEPFRSLTIEAKEVGEMISTYVRVALASGTDSERVRAYLKEVRRAILLCRGSDL